MKTRKTLLAAMACAAAAAALFGCLDALAPPTLRGGSARLAVAPVFEGMGTAGLVPGDVDLIQIVLSRPPAPDTTLSFVITPGQDSIVVTIHITLPTILDTVGVTCYAIRTSDGDTLYQGAGNYPVQVGLPLPPSPLVANYVGPGRNIQSIAISPAPWAGQPGDTVRFGYTALDSTGATIVGMPVLFGSRNTAIVSVDAFGLAKAVAVGSAYVVVTSGARSSVKDSALVTVATTPPSVIALAATAATFADTAGTADPPSQTIDVTNTGGGTLSGLSVGAISYGAGGSGWLAATLSGSTAPATLTLTAAKGSLAAGTYTATVPVHGTASNSPQSVSVSFTIAPAVPTIALSPTSITFTDTALTSDPAPLTVSITNAGLGTLSGLAIGAISYGAGGSGWLTASLSGATAPATLTLTAAKGSLAAGTYTATVPVQAAGASNTPQNVTVTLTIAAAPTIVLSPAAATFTDTLLTTDPASQTVTVSNSGGALADLTVGTISYGAGGSGWLTASLGGAAAPATLTLTAAKGSLAAGTYTATVPVQSASAGNSPQNLSVTFTIAPAPNIALSSPSVVFTDTVLTSDPSPQTVTVSSSGGPLADLTLGTITYGAGGSGWLAASLSGAAAPATLTLTAAKGSLAAGTYTATVLVQSASAGNSPQNLSVTFTIAPPPLVTLSVSPGYRVMLGGDTVTLAVTGKDGSGNPAPLLGLSFGSRAPGVTAVSASGLVTAVTAGTAVIVAQAPTATGTAGDSLIVVVPAAGSPVVAAIGDGRAFDGATTGGTVSVLVLVDMRAAAGDTLGSYNAQLNWSATSLTYDTAFAVAGGFAAPTINATNVSTGQLRFGSADPSGRAGSFALIQVQFTAAAAGSTPLSLTLTDLSTAKTFVQLLPVAVIVSGGVVVQ